MGVAQGLGVPLPATAGTICVGAFLETRFLRFPIPRAGFQRPGRATGRRCEACSVYLYWPWLVDLSGVPDHPMASGTAAAHVGGEVYDAIMGTVTSAFHLTPLLLLPPVVVIVLIRPQKPTLPTFTAGIIVGAVPGCGVPGHAIDPDGRRRSEACSWLCLKGLHGDTGNEIVNSMVQRGEPHQYAQYHRSADLRRRVWCASAHRWLVSGDSA